MKPAKVIIRLFSSFLWTGYAPIAPGTVGSLAGMVVWFALPYKTMRIRLPIILLFFLIGLVVATLEEREMDKKDPGSVVIDEVVGMWILLILTGCLHLRGNILKTAVAFIMFRAFDVAKIPPMRSVEKLRGGLGIMLDDIVAAIYSAIVVNLVFSFL